MDRGLMSQGSAYGIPIDTDGTLSANSDFLVPSQKAVKTYVDTEIAAIPASDLTAVLTAGNTTGGNDIVVSAGDDIIIDDTANRIAGIGASSEILSLDTTTYPSLTELSYVKGVTSGIQAQINAISSGSGTRVLNTQFSLASTATAAEEILYAFEITAGTWVTNEWIDIAAYVRKTSGTGTWAGKVYLNNANSLVGATQYGGAWSYSTANINATWSSRIWMSGASAQVGQPTTGGVKWSGSGIGGTMGSSSYSSAASIWVLISSTKATAGDAASIIVASTTIYKL